MPLPLTLTAAQVFDPLDGSSNPRGANMGEARTWGTELEVLIAYLLAQAGQPGETTVSGTSKTLAAADLFVAQLCTNASAVTLTAPANIAKVAGVLQQIPIIQRGDGAVSVVAASGATINCGLDVEGAEHRTTAYKRASMTLVLESNVDGVSAVWELHGATKAL